jgi:hypothetical protein
MTPLSWAVAIGGTLLGLVVGFLIGRLKLLYSFNTPSYDCARKEITVTVTNGTNLHRVLGYAMPGASAGTVVPPPNAKSQDYDPAHPTVTLQDNSWPSNGQVSYFVWGATFSINAQMKDCGGSSSAFLTTKELEARPDLRITVPDGPRTGAYTAKATDSMKWQAMIGNSSYMIVCDSPDSLTIQSPSGSARARRMATGPFSATFSGALFQATGEVLVTKE